MKLGTIEGLGSEDSGDSARTPASGCRFEAISPGPESRENPACRHS